MKLTNTHTKTIEKGREINYILNETHPQNQSNRDVTTRAIR